MKGPITQNTEKLFNSIATNYDRLNHLLSLGIDKCWRQRALRHIINKQQPQNILDIACGTGDFSIAIAQKVHKESKVYGLDLSEGMLNVMHQKVKTAHLEHIISTKHGNCETLPFDDNSFDCATIAFGIRNFEHRETALNEIRRVLKPGGRLVILELSVPECKIIRWLYLLYFKHILPVIGGWISGEKPAYRYLPASVIHFPPKSQWIATMQQCGYTDVYHQAYTLGICRLYVGRV
ncbi:MAG: bifunctional demethylmenaquinone methyltransferase/2-methoxy-6-polyprenyl-1,4-benzoquinol methylase UbiE [Bacteroidales bacterium]|nr:bifunctional demethylmenaquinone methyltransferase/2-methoxy-6-polyprenyl-1,4-benzoquinol methylase UbiE [Candidatus Colimorpha onthohippi]